VTPEMRRTIVQANCYRRCKWALQDAPNDFTAGLRRLFPRLTLDCVFNLNKGCWEIVELESPAIQAMWCAVHRPEDAWTLIPNGELRIGNTPLMPNAGMLDRLSQSSARAEGERHREAKEREAAAAARAKQNQKEDDSEKWGRHVAVKSGMASKYVQGAQLE
jgi:hypothetical protein